MRRSGQRHADRGRAALDGHRGGRRRGGAARRPAARPRRREARAEVLHAVRRVADKLLHAPTVRVKELANETGAVSYAAALAELFALDPEAVDAVTRPEGAEHERLTPRLRLGTRASLLATTQSELRRRRWSATGSAARSSWSRSPPTATVQAAAPLEPDRRHRRLRLRAARRPARRRGRRRRALAQGPADRRRRRHRARRRTPREDPRDVVVARDGLTLGELPGRLPGRHRLAAPGRPAARPRPRLGRGPHPWQRRHPDRQGPPGEYDAVVLARAGLARLGRLDEVTEVLDPLQMLPAPGQGALAVECRADDDLVAALAALDDRASGPPSRPSGPCWPPSRAAARRRSGPSPRWSRARTATSCGCARWRCRTTGRCRADVRDRRPTTPPGVGPGWPRDARRRRGRSRDAQDPKQTGGSDP